MGTDADLPPTRHLSAYSVPQERFADIGSGGAATGTRQTAQEGGLVAWNISSRLRTRRVS